MQKLSKFVDEKELANLKFSDLTNTIRISNRKVFIPEMEIKSSISVMSIMGTHTFDQEMDYKLKVPLKNFRKKDSDEAFGAIQDEGSGKTTLFLTIKGNSKDYKIAYDKQAVRSKITQNLKKEKEEFKSLFRKKTAEVKPESKKELKEDEYFDFD